MSVDTSTFTTPAPELFRAIINAALFASTDDTLPAICSVHLKAGRDHVLHVESTDRYAATITELKCDGGPFEAVVDAKDAVRVVKALAAILKPFRYLADPPQVTVAVVKGTTFATFTLTGYPGPDTSLTATTVDTTYVRPVRVIPSPEGAFVTAFNTAHLAKLAKVDGGTKDRTARLVMQPGMTPAVASLTGDDALQILLMPVRAATQGINNQAPATGQTVRFEGAGADQFAKYYRVTGIDAAGVSLDAVDPLPNAIAAFTLPRALATVLKMTVVSAEAAS